MPDTIFLISDGGELEPMVESAYAKELDLQELLAKHCDLLPGDQIDADSPRRWLFVGQEVAVSDSADGADRWSVDHLFLDQDGIPTIVETKRSRDTRLRREVIGQLLEYAANAVRFWRTSKLISDFQRTCTDRGETPDMRLSVFLGADPSPERTSAFWYSVKHNLEEERVRLILVADEIPLETRRIVEFLNGQMNKAEIIAVELQQFRGGNRRVLVPRVYGRTERTTRSKKSSAKDWNEGSLLSEMSNHAGADAATVAKNLIEWITPLAFEVSYSGGSTWGRFNPGFAFRGEIIWPFNFSSTGQVQFCFGDFVAEVCATEADKIELLNRINRIPGVNFATEKLGRYPSFEMVGLVDPEALSEFKDAVQWIINAIKSGE